MHGEPMTPPFFFQIECVLCSGDLKLCLSPISARDNVDWDEDQEKLALETVAKQAASPVPEILKGS